MGRESQNAARKAALKVAFPHTIPVMTGYLFLGMAFGVLLQSKGYGWYWAALLSITVYAGSMQFVAVNLLTGPFAPISAALITLMVNARHVFYGFSMLERYRAMGKARPYLIFGLTDETFSLLYATPPPKDLDRRAFSLWVTALDQFYWVTGSVLGAVIGAQLRFNVKGIEFAMTALFVSIFVEQWRSRSNWIPAGVGLAGALLCLLVFGPDRFLIPSMGTLALSLTLLRRQVERGMEA